MKAVYVSEPINPYAICNPKRRRAIVCRRLEDLSDRLRGNPDMVSDVTIEEISAILHKHGWS